MQPSEEDQGQSVVLASHSGLGFVAVHVGKVLKSLHTYIHTYIHTYFSGSSPRGFSESILYYKIINQVHDNKNITMIKEDKGQ